MRLQAFEFHDYDWYPGTWREIVTGCTASFPVVFDVFRPIVARLAHALRSSNADTILDLCSGSAGSLLAVHRRLAEAEGCRVGVVLSDKYPNIAEFDRISRRNKDVRFMPLPLDADAAPANGAFRTLFASFHHFPPDRAVRLLQSAVRDRVGIGVFEYTDRHIAWLLSALLSPFFCWLTAPWSIRPFTARTFFWVYIVPVPVLLLAWDAVASGLRTYRPQQLRSLVAALDEPGYVWEIGSRRRFVFNVSYLIGYPLRRPEEDPGNSATAGVAAGD